MESDLLTAEQLAQRLEVRASTIRRWFREGRIPAIRLTTKVIRYRLDDVVAALAENQIEKGGDQ